MARKFSAIFEPPVAGHGAAAVGSANDACRQIEEELAQHIDR